VIVADTNLIGYFLIQGPGTPAAEAVFEKDPVWAAPVLWRSEFRNVLATYMRNMSLSLSDALTLMADAESLLENHEHQVDSAPVLALAYGSGTAAYDCEFVHLAEILGLPLVTADKKVLQNFPNVAVSLEDFVK
jgi:predicted nucleic acid-binding protein